MKVKKGQIVGALLASVALATAACGTSSGTTASSSGGKTTITIWNDALAASSSTVPEAKSFLTKGVALFEKQNPDINVKIIPEPFAASTSFDTLLRSAELAQTTPDIGQLYVGGQVLQNSNYLVALNKYLPKSYYDSLSGWQFVTSKFQTGGSIYAVPYGAGYYYAVYYNKTLFKKAGITGPMPTTWSGLLALGKKIKAKGITPFEFGEKEGYMGAWTQDALMSGLVGDKGVLAMYNGKASLDSPTLTQPYTAWHQMYAEGLTNSSAPSLSYTTAIADFAAGQAAMTITAQFYDTQFENGLGKNNVGLFPVPTLPGSQYPKVLSGGPNNSYVIFKTSTHIADDIKLIKFLTSPEVQEMSVNELGQLPNNVSFKPTAAFDAQQPLLASLYGYIKQGYVLSEAFDNVMPGSIANYWYQTNSGVFSGSQSPASAAGSMQSQMQSYLQANAAS
ncbi:MAG TPA: ABC transporter substrate-binding protein [Streptosporangiaceae bacterium]|nr:ABC transporter substrate-binding protein [Streptosporangiaceae bacterium]